MKCNGSTYNLYNKNKIDDLEGQKSDEGIDFYIPIGAILIELPDYPNNMSRIESKNVHLLSPPKPITLKLSGTIDSTKTRRPRFIFGGICLRESPRPYAHYID